MGRRIVRTRGVVIRTRRLGETSKLVTLYTAEHGKLKVTAKGARRPRSRFGAALELFSEVQAICYLRDERELQTLSDCDVIAAHEGLLPALERLAYASAACELVDGLTIEGEPNTRLYQCLTGMLQGLEEVEPPQLEPLFWYFQLRVAAAMGFRPELDQCVVCRRPLAGTGWWFSAPQGGAVCQDCGPADGIRMAESNLRLLAGLHRLRGYRRELVPAAPERPAEVRAALRGFLEYHGGARGPLRALEFLRALDASQPLPASAGCRAAGLGQPAPGARAPNRRVT
jgi:DNA repair protein RecO (recombination protein O)